MGGRRASQQRKSKLRCTRCKQKVRSNIAQLTARGVFCPQCWREVWADVNVTA
jgi:hypothetical protein